MSNISSEKIDEIRQSIDIVDIVREYVPLTQRGKNFFGVCPFHQDHSPSMSVSKERQMFKCFSCGAAGNVFKFVSEIESISYLEAVGKLAQKIGIHLDIGERKISTKYEAEYQIMHLAMLYYQNNLNTSSGALAREYLNKRGLNDEMIEVFQIGLSFSKNDIYQFLKKKKIKDQDLVKVGLVNQDGLKYTDVFQNRILFPIHTPDGQVVGFSGRIFTNSSAPKYINSRETVIFKKGNILFNYHRARDAVRLSKQVVLVEGNMDALRMYSCGIKNTVALMGTSLTNEQIVLLQKLRVPIVLMLDNDSAGENATMHNGELLEQAGLTVLVVRLSGEKDPDEYILSHGVDAMNDNIRHAISFMEFKLNYFKQNKNLQDTSELAMYVRNVLKTLVGKDAITIDITLNKLAEEYHLSYEMLKNELQNTNTEKKVFQREETVLKTSKLSRYDLSARYILYFMMNDAKYIETYKQKLGFFQEEIYRGIANEILYYYDMHKTIHLADFLSYVENSPLKDIIYEIIGSIKEEEHGENSIVDYIYNMKEISYKEKIKSLKQEMKSASDVLKKEELANEILECNRKIQEIKKERSVKND